MSERSQPSEHLPSKDPVRVVYHDQNRTFARLFNERSLDEVKDVVRRKLGLGRESDVSLKQMGPDTLVDLEDDDDFQAFRVLLKSCVSVDIQVTVGKSQGSTVPPPKPREKASAGEPTATAPLVLPFEQPGRPTAFGEASAHLENARTTEASATVVKTPDPFSKKRKVSFDTAALAVPDEPAERRTSKKVTAVSHVASAETVGTPTPPKPVGAEEPPKKRQKKETTNTKHVQPTETAQSPAAKTPDAPKSKPRKSAVADRGSEVETSMVMDPLTSQLPAKKSSKRKKADGAGTKKTSAPIDQRDTDKPLEQPNNTVNGALQLASEKPQATSPEGSTSMTRKSTKTKAPRGTVCASIPQTNASTSVQSEVAAAILSGILSKASETVVPPEPPKQESVKKGAKKHSASSRSLPVQSTAVLSASTSERSNIPTERRTDHVALTNGSPQQTMELSGPPCPICLGEPFHIRYCCPTVLKGPDAIQERLEELKGAGTGGHQSLIEELEGLLRDSKATSKPTLDTASVDSVRSRGVSPSLTASLPRTPTIPSNSYVSEVTVESRDEGSSSESSDDTSQEGVDYKVLSASRIRQTCDEQPSSAIDDLEAIIRGPVLKRQSILHVIDRIVGDDEEEDSESEENKAELEEDPDEEVDRSRRRLSRRNKRSSDSESDDGESRSPSSARSVERTLDHPQPSAQGSNKLVEATKHQDGDVVMGDADPPVLEGQDDGSSEETHVGSEDRVNVDHEPIGENGATAIIEKQPSSPAPRAFVPPPSDAPSNGPQESAQTSASNQVGGAMTASKFANEVEADPIEPADDSGPPADPIEAPDDVGSLFDSVAQSTPKPGVTKRIKTRGGQILDDEAEQPVLLDQLIPKIADAVTPLPTKGKSRRKATETPTSQEPAPTRKSPRFSSLPPSTSTPATIALLNHLSKGGIKNGKVAKTPAKRSEKRSDALQSSAKGGAVQYGAPIACTPSLVEWETIPEPSSPSLQLDEPSVHIDELMSSSPQPADFPIRGRLNNKGKKGRSRKSVTSSQAENLQGKERLLDLSSSQTPFPHSQNQNPPPPTACLNGKEREEKTDSDSDSDLGPEGERKVSKKKMAVPVRYRPLSQLASHAALYSPSLPTPTNKSVANEKAKKRVIDEDSSSSSDADEGGGSEHIPRGRRAGSVLETKRKNLLCRI